jgi:hypothetical protein
MRLVWCALVIAVVASCERASEPIVEIRIPRFAPVVGEQFLIVEDVTMNVAYELTGPDLEYESRQHVESLVKNVAVDGHAVTVAEVTYKVIDDAQVMDGKREQVPDPRAGKTYHLSREDGRAIAIRMYSGEGSREELAMVTDDFETIGLEDELGKIFAEKTWKTGQKVVLTADEIARTNAQRPGTPGRRRTLLAMELTLRSVKSGVARFSLVLGLRYEEETGSYDVRLRGETSLDLATGRSLEVAGSGAVTGQVEGTPTKGTMSWRMTTRWAASRSAAP